jgi:hypothetical protein
VFRDKSGGRSGRGTTASRNLKRKNQSEGKKLSGPPRADRLIALPKKARSALYFGDEASARESDLSPERGVAAVEPSPLAPKSATSGGSSPTNPATQLTLLNMVATEADSNRAGSAAIVRENPDWVCGQIERYTEGPTLFAPRNHRLLPRDVNRRHLRRILIAAHERQPNSFETLLGTQGVGPATVLSLSLLAELIFEAPASHRDPAERFRLPAEQSADQRHWADYAYAHGGKDGTPFPVDRETYDRNIAILTDAVRKARIGQNEKMGALRRLSGRA